jgi:hypothetical protein
VTAILDTTAFSAAMRNEPLMVEFLKKRRRGCGGIGHRLLRGGLFLGQGKISELKFLAAADSAEGLKDVRLGVRLDNLRDVLTALASRLRKLPALKDVA